VWANPNLKVLAIRESLLDGPAPAHHGLIESG